MTALDKIYLKLDSDPENFIQWLRNSEHVLFSIQDYDFQERYQFGFEAGKKEGYKEGLQDGYDSAAKINEKY